MKRVFLILIILISLPAFCILANAEQPSEDSELLEQSGIYEIADELDKQTKDFIKDAGLEQINAESVYKLDFSSFLKAAYNLIFKSDEIIKAFFVLVATIFLSALVDSLAGDFLKKGNSDIFNICCALFILISVVPELASCISSCEAAIKSAGAFTLAVFPIMCTLLAAQGKTLSSAVFNGAAVGVSQIINTLCSEFFIPLTNILLALGVSSAAASSLPVDKLIKLVRKYMLIALSIAASIYFSVLSLKGAVSSAADETALRAVKVAAGNFVPVIGSAISDSAAAVISSLSVTKGAVGTFGIVALIGIFLPVIIKSALWLMCFEAAAFLCSVFSLESAEQVLKNLSSAMSVLMSLMFFCSLIFLINFGILTSMRGSV